MDTTALARWLVATLAIAAGSVTIGKTHAFSLLRGAVRRRSERLGRLIGCPYCMAHWFALAVALWERPSESVIENLAVALALVAASSLAGLGIVAYLNRLEAKP